MGTSSVAIRRVMLDRETVVLDAEGVAEAASCPACGARSSSVHDRYHRRPTDLPWRGWRVILQLTVRRFRCTNPACPRQTFAEPFADELPRRAQWTTGTVAYLTEVALAVGGEAGARLARASGISVSPDTLLRLLRRGADDVLPTPRVLGVDDLALRRSHRYATVLINLETHQPVDLLADRTAETLAGWLRAHPGVEVIVCDRAEAYAEGARRGAPDAVQVADRFHLSQNAGAAFIELLKSRTRSLDYLPVEPQPPLEAPLPPVAPAGPEALPGEERPLSQTQQRLADRRTARIERWRRVCDLGSTGASIGTICRELHMDRKTARRLLATTEPSRNRRDQSRPGLLNAPVLQPFVRYLQDRWQQGCTNASQLHREIIDRGFTGSRSLTLQALRPWRSEPARCPKRRVKLRVVCLRAPEALATAERLALADVLAADEPLRTGYHLLHEFRRILRSRTAGALDSWLAEAEQSNLAPFVGLARSLRGDRDAVDRAITEPWSTGPVEGHVHRVKLLKRQGYGRAKLDLLRRRVLAA